MRCALAFFFNATATTEIYTLSLHDALPILGGDTIRPRWPLPIGATRSSTREERSSVLPLPSSRTRRSWGNSGVRFSRSEEHTSELQSRPHLVCRLLLEKKKNTLKTLETYKS